MQLLENHTETNDQQKRVNNPLFKSYRQLWTAVVNDMDLHTLDITLKWLEQNKDEMDQTILNFLLFTVHLRKRNLQQANSNQVVDRDN